MVDLKSPVKGKTRINKVTMESGIAGTTNWEIEILPIELSEHVLTWLPVKDLLRYRSVCKGWKSLIDSPSFKSKHCQAQQQSSLLIWCNARVGSLFSFSASSCNPPVPIDLHQFCDSPMFRPFGVVNGLVYFASKSFLVIWNPATLECKKIGLPFMNLVYEHVGIPGEGLIMFDEICAFGFDSETQDYKVMCCEFAIQFSGPSDKALLKLYSLRNDSWKVVLVDFPRVSGVVTGDSFVGGKFYWFVRECGLPTAPGLVIFDFSDEGLEWTALPEHLTHGEEMVAVAHRGVVGLMTVYVDRHCELWVKGEDGWSWSMKFNVLLPSMAARPRGLLKDDMMIFESETDDCKSRNLMLIDLTTGCCKNLGLAASEFWIFKYMESLVSINQVLS